MVLHSYNCDRIVLMMQWLSLRESLFLGIAESSLPYQGVTMPLTNG
jgi:hypothetical protein